MHPVLLSFHGLTISSFGFFLVIAALTGVVVFWRLGSVYDIDEERRLDISLLAFLGGLFGARAYFVLGNLSRFNSILQVIALNRFPGMSFIGGFLAGGAIVYLLCRYFKLNFFQVADFALVGVFGGLIAGSFGCLLSSCQYGYPSTWPVAVSQAGLIGNRFPIQLLLVIAFFLSFRYLWKMALRFHFTGKVASSGLVVLGLIKYLTSFLRADASPVFFGHSAEQLFSLSCITLGTWLYYHLGKRKVVTDLRVAARAFTSPKHRRMVLLKIRRACYNLRINWRLRLVNLYKQPIGRSRSFLKGLNVKFNSPKF